MKFFEKFFEKFFIRVQRIFEKSFAKRILNLKSVKIKLA